MSRSRNYDREFTQNDRLKRENSELKRALSKLQKVIDRLNLDVEQYRNLRDLVKKQAQDIKVPAKVDKNRVCFECGKGVLIIHKIPRLDGMFYVRRCSIPGCGHQTRLKKYDEKVEEN
jgi:hypothetical protein